VVVDPASGECTTVDNTLNLNAAQGAGIQAGKKIAELGVQALLTGHLGPKVFATLRAAGIDVHVVATGKGAEAVAQYLAGTLKRAESPDVEGHCG
jgi:predicted Fe-Mo cluster-binding NifX family protein